MDRRYYLAKFFVILMAAALALFGGTTRGPAPRPDAHLKYAAPAQIQDATWHATLSAARVITCLVSRTVHRLA